MNKSEALKNLTSYGDEDEYLDEENNKEFIKHLTTTEDKARFLSLNNL